MRQNGQIQIAPDSTKNSKNSGGVNRSHCSTSTERSLARLIITAPIIMHTRSEDRPHISQSPTPSMTQAMLRASLLPRERKKRLQIISTKPMAVPRAKAPTISSKGLPSRTQALIS